MWRSLGSGAGSRRMVLAVGHAARSSVLRYTQIATLHAVFGPLARAARSFAPRFTQLRHGARSFFSDPKEGPPHLPARLMLHAVFGASETACTVPQLRVAWAETACSVGQLRAPRAGTPRQNPTATPSSSLPLPPAATLPPRASRTAACQSARTSQTHAYARSHWGNAPLAFTRSGQKRPKTPFCLASVKPPRRPGQSTCGYVPKAPFRLHAIGPKAPQNPVLPR